jgi:molybdopterin adenylyltransferase
MKIGRVTSSDRASRGIYEDLSGPEIERVVSEVWKHPVEFLARLVADEEAEIKNALLELCDGEGCPLVITTGGTGPGPRDVTPEATKQILHKELPGFGEVMRMKNFQKVPTAILTRAVAGIRNRTLVINLPGNPKAIGECLPLLVPAIEECLRHLGTLQE